MKTIYNAFMIAAVGALTLACVSDKEFLTENPKSIYTIDNAYGSSDQVTSTLVAAYTEMQNANYCDGMTLNGNHTDLFADWKFFSGETKHPGTWNTSQGKSKWDSYYKIIAYSNQALYAAELPQISWNTPEEKTLLVAEASFLKGFSYLRLAEYFGGVPIVEEFSETLKFDYRRETRTDTYLYAIGQLKVAYENLPLKPRAGRAGKGAAAILLSEAYLGLGVDSKNMAVDGKDCWKWAQDYAQACIDIHPLMTHRFGVRANPADKGSNLGVPNYNPDGTVYSDLFYKQNPRLAENTEAVWIMVGCDGYAQKSDYSIATGINPWTGATMYSTILQVASAMDAPALRDVVIDDGTKPWPDGAISHFYKGPDPGRAVDTPGIVPNGVAEYPPTWFAQVEMFDAAHNNGTLNDDRHKEGVAYRSSYPITDPNHPEYGLEVYYGTDPKMIGWDRVDKSSENVAMEFFTVYDKHVPVDNWGYDPDDYYSGNFFTRTDYRDFYVYRSAAAYLLLAEACLRGGDSGKAADAINAVRQRSGANPFGAGQVNLHVILDERARELLYEEDRWATFCRMEPEVWKERIYAYGMYTYRDGAALKPVPSLFPETQQFSKWTGTLKWDLWPIPVDYIDLNSGDPEGMAQNPGWSAE